MSIYRLVTQFSPQVLIEHKEKSTYKQMIDVDILDVMLKKCPMILLVRSLVLISLQQRKDMMLTTQLPFIFLLWFRKLDKLLKLQFSLTTKEEK